MSIYSDSLKKERERERRFSFNYAFSGEFLYVAAVSEMTSSPSNSLVSFSLVLAKDSLLESFICKADTLYSHQILLFLSYCCSST